MFALLVGVARLCIRYMISFLLPTFLIVLTPPLPPPLLFSFPSRFLSSSPSLRFPVPKMSYFLTFTNPDDDEKINEIARERGYKNRDTIHVTKEGLGELYEEKLKMFFAEYVVFAFFLSF